MNREAKWGVKKVGMVRERAQERKRLLTLKKLSKLLGEQSLAQALSSLQELCGKTALAMEDR